MSMEKLDYQEFEYPEYNSWLYIQRYINWLHSFKKLEVELSESAQEVINCTINTIESQFNQVLLEDIDLGMSDKSKNTELQNIIKWLEVWILSVDDLASFFSENSNEYIRSRKWFWVKNFKSLINFLFSIWKLDKKYFQYISCPLDIIIFSKTHSINWQIKALLKRNSIFSIESVLDEYDKNWLENIDNSKTKERILNYLDEKYWKNACL